MSAGHLGLFLLTSCFYYLIYADYVYIVILVASFVIGALLIFASGYISHIIKMNTHKYDGTRPKIYMILSFFTFAVLVFSFAIALFDYFYISSQEYSHVLFWLGIIFLCISFLTSLLVRFLELEGSNNV